jgi:DNA-binding MarR family transcriptional regulator
MTGSEANAVPQPEWDQERLRQSALRSDERQALYADLRQHPGSTQAELAERTGLDRHAVGGMLALMLFANLITKTQDPVPCYAVREEGEDAEGSGPRDL